MRGIALGASAGRENFRVLYGVGGMFAASGTVMHDERGRASRTAPSPPTRGFWTLGDPPTTTARSRCRSPPPIHACIAGTDRQRHRRQRRGLCLYRPGLALARASLRRTGWSMRWRFPFRDRRRSAIAATMPKAFASPVSSLRTGPGPNMSQAQVFVRGQYTVVGRFNLATADANAPDATVRVRGLGIRIATPDGQEWRSAMI